MLHDTSSAWGDNFLNHLECTFSEFVQTFYRWYHKVQMHEQVYMNLQTKQNLNERVKEYYEQILTLTNSF
jgi:hypothetical protein